MEVYTATHAIRRGTCDTPLGAGRGVLRGLWRVVRDLHLFGPLVRRARSGVRANETDVLYLLGTHRPKVQVY